jgi:predicted dehydrogenase
MAKSPSKVFKTDKRIKLGIWGLGRGMSFFKTCEALNIDVVAGCDFNQKLRDGFTKGCPGAYVTDDVDKFLAQDIDAVLLATYCPEHAADAIKCLEAGKHVVSEVTAFHTLAEGVRLVEAVEKSGKVYQLAENYPYMRSNMWLARKWKEGLFGDLMYAEYEYVHECRVLAYTYGDRTPVIPGNQTHSWRSWLNFHYYNTHSLGPVMHITGLRPTRVTALPSEVMLAGYPMSREEFGMGSAAPSLITMSNGSVVRNLMGATTNDTHHQRIWGTLGAAEVEGDSLSVRLGASGRSPKLPVIANWDGLGELAAKTGHGGGDFWVLYHFARQILEGVPGPFDVYSASDCTLQGILAYKSSRLNGQPLDIPDFRDKKQREAHRNDHYAQPRFDYKNGLFPKGADESVTLGFAACMKDLIDLTGTYRAYRDWASIAPDMQDPNHAVTLAEKLLGKLPVLQQFQKQAKQMVDLYPGSTAARVLGEMLAIGDAPIVSKTDYAKRLKGDLARLKKSVAKTLATRGPVVKANDPWTTPFFVKPKVSKLYKKTKEGLKGLKAITLKERAGWSSVVQEAHTAGFINIHNLVGDRDGIVYIGFAIKAAQAGTYDLMLGHDGGVHVWLNGKSVHLDPVQLNPASADRSKVSVKLKKGANELMVALDTAAGGGWGVYARLTTPKADRKKTGTLVLPTEA